MPSYQYAKADGSMGTFDANTSDEALKLVKTRTDAAKGTGVMPAQTATLPVTPASPVTPPGTTDPNKPVVPTTPAPTAKTSIRYNDALTRDPAQIASSVKNADGTTTVTYKDGQTQIIKGDVSTQYDESGNPIVTPPVKKTPQELMEDSQAALDAEALRVQNQITGIQNGTIPLDAGQLAQIEGLKLQFQQLIDQQKLTNTGAEGLGNIRGYQTGAAEYDPTFQAKTIGSIVTAGINKIADLNIKMASAVAALTQGFKDNNISAIKSAWDVYSKTAEQRANTLQKTIDNTQAAIKEARETREAEEKAYFDRVTKPMNDVITEAAKNGATPEQLEAMANAPDVASAVIAAGGAFVKPETEVIKFGDDAAYLIDKRTGKIIRSFGAGGGSSGGGTITGGGGFFGSSTSNPNVAAYAGVVDTILASGKFTKDQAASVRRAINSGEDPFTVIKNNAKNIMGATEAGTLGKYEVAKKAMLDLNRDLEAYYKAGGKTNLLTGKYEKVVNKLGEVEDPELVELATQIAANLQVYRNAVSGTAYSVQEGAQIANIFPSINKTQALNKAIVSGRMKAFESTIDGNYENVLGASTYQKLKEAEKTGGASVVAPKGTMTDHEFVAKSFTLPANASIGNYEKVINATPAGQIPVVDNATGAIGYIPYLEFNSSKYTKL